VAFYGNVFDTYVYAPRFEFEDKDKNMDQWELHNHGVMNVHAKSTHNEVCVYPAEWKKEIEDEIIKTANNDNANDVDLHSECEEYEKPKAQDFSDYMRLFHSPVFRAPVETMSTVMDHPNFPYLLLPWNAKENYFFFEAVLEEAGIDTSSAQTLVWGEAGFDYDSTSQADFF
jgi:hypothetical protein